MESRTSVSSEKEEAQKAEYIRIPSSLQHLNKCGPVVCSLSDMLPVADESFRPLPTVEVMTQMAKQVLTQVKSSCLVCHKPSMFYCSKCHVTPYCSQKCQRLNWRAEHRERCGDAKGGHFTAVIKLLNTTDHVDMHAKYANSLQCYADVVVFRPETTYLEAMSVLVMGDINSVCPRPFILPLDGSTPNYGINQCTGGSRLSDVAQSKVILIGHTTLGGSCEVYNPSIMEIPKFK